MTSTPRPAAARIASQERISIACIELLGRLENIISQLAEGGSQEVIDRLEFAKRLLAEYLEFADAHFQGADLDSVRARLREVYERTKWLELQAQPAGWGSIKRLFGLKAGESDVVRDGYAGLRNDYLQLTGDFFVLCLSRLAADDPLARELQQGIDAFVDEVERKW